MLQLIEPTLMAPRKMVKWPTSPCHLCSNHDCCIMGWWYQANLSCLGSTTPTLMNLVQFVPILCLLGASCVAVTWAAGEGQAIHLPGMIHGKTKPAVTRGVSSRMTLLALDLRLNV